MIRANYAHDVVTGVVKYFEFAGLSTDTKPTDGVSTGSLFHEIDTKKVYAFNEAGAADAKWVEQMTLSEE